jgi:hypothetical protein
MYYVLRHQEFARFSIPFVAQNLFLLKLSTWSAILAESLGWTFIWFAETRYAVLIILLGLHLGIEYSMNIPMFEHIMIASFICFIPGEDAEKFIALIRGRLRKSSKSTSAKHKLPELIAQ